MSKVSWNANYVHKYLLCISSQMPKHSIYLYVIWLLAEPKIICLMLMFNIATILLLCPFDSNLFKYNLCVCFYFLYPVAFCFMLEFSWHQFYRCKNFWLHGRGVQTVAWTGWLKSEGWKLCKLQVS